MGSAPIRKDPRLSRIAWGIAAIGVGFIILVGYIGGQARVDCGYPRLEVAAWVDADADGQRGAGEAPLAGVVVRIPTTNGYELGGTTGADGRIPAPRKIFAPCGLRWKSAMAIAPAGYVATTPTELRSSATDYIFGFRAAP